MPDNDQQIAEEYIRLALAVERHIPDFIDAYYGPEEWRQEAQEGEKRPIKELIQETERLMDATMEASYMDPNRRDHLLGELRAIHASLRFHYGEQVPLIQEAQALFDITPEWVEESVFQEAHRELNDLLPGDDPLHDRVQSFRKSLEFPLEGKEAKLREIVYALRRRVSRRFPLPDGESFDLQLVYDKPWGAFNRYLGKYHSLIEINVDRPGDPIRMAGLLAHEGYPGHHTELAIKEERLVKGKGWQEYRLIQSQSPSAVIAEGIAMRALYILMPDEELIPWLEEDVFPRFGFQHADAKRALAVQRARHKLNGLSGNAALMLLDQKASNEQVIAYVLRYGLGSEEEAWTLIHFIKFARAYVFLYHLGAEMLDELVAERGNPDQWFTRLLSEPITPARVRAWIDLEDERGRS
jgi:hypothetical protein